MSAELPGLVDDSEDEEEDEASSIIYPTGSSLQANVNDSLVATQLRSEVSDSKFDSDPRKVAGNIARQEFRDFWTNELQADVWTLNMIREGYKLPFSSTPGPYQERNNKSARTEKPYLIESVSSLRERGVVKRLKCRPLCTNPLTVSSRLVEGKLKKRLY